MTLSVIALNCTLKRGEDPSSTDRILREAVAEFEKLGTRGEILRVANFNVLPGVTSDEGPGDDWPAIRQRVVAADILLIGTPIWLGQPSSIAKRVIERLDAFLGETDDKGRMPAYGKVASVAVVGNEDGAHHCHAELFQALNDVGFTLPPGAGTYWVGEAMGSTDYKDLPSGSDKTRHTSAMLARNAVHLATFLRSANYPGMPTS
ncbi:flavodoxin family protein [Methylobrevis pamukkalensis]|uniref:NADPH-dependent FMN reductase n=1 Tax=Methylobrevis pamukkalensis TaxID=1439726 RepID=A0A1E3H1A3_9HYPH|nr:NAD(P)H-dependent oxidoreductase [Methylobrevis pamukkalensis]ODN70087.1 NADPH-dependent FMN reductase [Methylobrevis pamukkalensis]